MRPLLSTYEVSRGGITCSKYGRHLPTLRNVEKLRPGGEAWCGEQFRWTWTEVDLGNVPHAFSFRPCVAQNLYLFIQGLGKSG